MTTRDTAFRSKHPIPLRTQNEIQIAEQRTRGRRALCKPRHHHLPPSQFLCAFEGAVVVVSEVLRQRDPAAIKSSEGTVRAAILEELGLTLDRPLLIRARTIPKTSSGKIQRRKCAELYNQGRLEVVHGSAQSAAVAPQDEGEAISVESVMRLISEELGKPAARVDPKSTAAQLGLDSMAMMNLQQRLEDTFGVQLPQLAVWYDESAETLTETLRAAPSREGMRRSPARAWTAELPVSPGQARLWMLAQLAPQSPLYNLLVAVRIRGPLARARAAARVRLRGGRGRYACSTDRRADVL